VRGVLSLAGLCDLTTAAELGLDNFAAQDLMGGTPKELPTQYQAADPMRLLPTGIRTILLHSAADRSVPIELSQNYAAAARAAGDNAELREVPNAGHFDMISPRSSAWTDVLYAIKDLIQQPDRGPYRYGHGWIG
jgi:pimeloyl-ACP methyl ester carboxylesterase